MLATAAVDRSGVGLDAHEVASLYGAMAARLRSAVGSQTRARDADVDDACQAAWGRLFLHREQVHPDTAMGWLIVTARRETLRLARAARRTVPLEGLGEGEDELDQPDRERPGTIRATDPLGPSLDSVVAARLALGAIDRLSERQRRLVWLQGLGLSYEEMSCATGESLRTVERQLRRAKKALREAA